MAEVRKKEVNDKYNTSDIKVKETSKNSKKENKEKKTSTKDSKKVDNSNKEKKGLIAKFFVFCNGVKSEFKKVHWTTKKDMVKYSISSIFFIVFCSLFFFLINVLFALVQSLLA